MISSNLQLPLYFSSIGIWLKNKEKRKSTSPSCQGLPPLWSPWPHPTAGVGVGGQEANYLQSQPRLELAFWTRAGRRVCLLLASSVSALRDLKERLKERNTQLFQAKARQAVVILKQE